MKFGKVEHPEKVDFSIPSDHPDTEKVLSSTKSSKNKPDIYVGCAKWSKTDLKNFYPRGTKDELSYYATQFNAIELNATFYRLFPATQFAKWKDKTPPGFLFFPKLTQDISHRRRLIDTERLVDEYLHNATQLEDRLGALFLQMHNNFQPKDINRVIRFVHYWPKYVPLAIEFRDTNWYNEPSISNQVYRLFQEKGIGQIIVDTAGRRDLLHMRLSTPWAFVRFVGANHNSDYQRLNDWVERIALWSKQGIRSVYFFIHQNVELESPLLARYFTEKLNTTLGTNLKVPQTISEAGNLFG